MTQSTPVLCTEMKIFAQTLIDLIAATHFCNLPNFNLIINSESSPKWFILVLLMQIIFTALLLLLSSCTIAYEV